MLDASSPERGSFFASESKLESSIQKYPFSAISHKAPPSGELAPQAAERVLL